MNSVVLLVKSCTECRVEKPGTEFYKGQHSWCKACRRAGVSARRAARRAEMGDEAWLEYQRRIVNASRARTGNKRGKAVVAAASEARRRLVALHRDEYDHLLRIVKYERGL